MAAVNDSTSVIPGIYNIELSTQQPGAPTPEPLYLTNNGEGHQLTVERPTGALNQEWSIQLPLEGGNFKIDSEDRIIIPALFEPTEALAASQDVIKSPDEISLIKNLQIWTFKPVRSDEKRFGIYAIRSNLYYNSLGSDHFLGVDKDSKKAIIHSSPVGPHPPPRPVWKLLGPINNKM